MITCEKFRELSSRPPWLASVAERAAWLVHKRSCENCNAYLNKKADEQQKRCTPEVIAQGKELMQALKDKDLQDPEFRAVTGEQE